MTGSRQGVFEARCFDRELGGQHSATGQRPKVETMITLGIILLLLALLFHVPIFWGVGVLLVLVGAVLFILGAAGREVGGRRHYY